MLKNACKASVEKLRQTLSLKRTLNLASSTTSFRFVPEFFLNPLNPNISVYILHTVLDTFTTALTRRFKLKNPRAFQVDEHFLNFS